MPRARPPRPDPAPEMPPGERARLTADLERRLRVLHRTIVAKTWEARRDQRARGLPSIGLGVTRTDAHNVTPRYGRNNPLRYQKTNESPARLDQSGSPL